MMVANSCLKMTDIFPPAKTIYSFLNEVLLKAECILTALTSLSFTYCTEEKEKKQVGRKPEKEVGKEGRTRKSKPL